MTQNKFKYIDLFCGIGGFHQAMSKFGGECVFAAEIDPDCIEVYRDNYGIDASHDMTQIDAERVPGHEVLCAGFPCQAFSKAGKQAGINDTRGTLFFEIERVLRVHHPQFILLENVRNLVSHDEGRTWKIITDVLNDIGYRLTKDPLILSPHQFGIPQLRERVYIVGKYDPNKKNIPLNIEFNDLIDKKNLSIYDILQSEDEIMEDCSISGQELKVLSAWDEFYKGIDKKVIGFPVNIDYFTYDGSLIDLPLWKQSHILRNKELYSSNKQFIDSWLTKWNNLEDFTPTQRKFEWQCGDAIESVFEGIIQMRPSGVRVKCPNVFPALVAMVQIPIIGRYKRRLTARECARLQSFPDSFRMCGNRHQALKQFGNSVNINVLEAIFSQLVKKYGPIQVREPKTTNAKSYTAKMPYRQLTLFEPETLYVSNVDEKLLVAPSRIGNRKWILDNMMYNFPISQDVLEANMWLKDVDHVVILKRTRPLGFFKVTKCEIVDKPWLEDHGYPVKSSKRSKYSNYILYHLERTDDGIPNIDMDNFRKVIKD